MPRRASRSPARAPAPINSPAASADTTWVVTGAAGHVGRTLAAHLAARNSSADVRRLDVVGDGVDYRADVCDAAAVSKALRNPRPHLVFVHLASAGMSGAPMLDRALCQRVNVDGTAACLRCCRAAAATSTTRVSFVYIST